MSTMDTIYSFAKPHPFHKGVFFPSPDTLVTQCKGIYNILQKLQYITGQAWRGLMLLPFGRQDLSDNYIYVFMAGPRSPKGDRTMWPTGLKPPPIVCNI